MFENVRRWTRGVLESLGLIEKLQKIEGHKKVNAGNGTFERIEQNKLLYQGFYKPWHHLEYLDSNRELAERDVMSMGMAKMSAQHMAKVVLNENFKTNIDETKHKEAKELIDSVFGHPQFQREFRRYAEYGFALGGFAPKVSYDDNYNVKIYFANADSFFALSQDSENIDEALLVNKFQRGDDYYSLLEWNEWINGEYTITLELYKSTNPEELGKITNLNSLFPNKERRTILTKVTRPTFTYIKPGIANNKDLTSPYGISIFENAKDTMRQIDYMFDFFFREFIKGEPRVAVSRSMLETHYDAKGNPVQVFNAGENVYAPILGLDEPAVNDLTIDIRADQIITSINAMLKIFAMQTGLSAGTFTFDGVSVKTATEVVSQDSATYQTRNDHITVMREGIKDLCVSIVEMHNSLAYYDTGKKEIKNFTRDDVEIDFDDSLFTDNNSKLDYYMKMKTGGLYPLKNILMDLHSVTDEEALEMVKQLNAEALGIDVVTQEQNMVEDELGEDE